MKLSFSKYHGTGNDFIIVDIRNRAIQLDTDSIAHFCHRRYGIGADGLILLDKSAEYDFSMRYFNADGKESSMCGNGGRCITAFANRLGIIDKETTFEAVDGIHHASILSKDNEIYVVKLQMSDVAKNTWNEDDIFLDTGSPHLVKVCSNLDNLDVDTHGRRIRHHDRFLPEGTNVNFIEEKGDTLFIRTYERGVESETLSCGTGVTAAALAWALRAHVESPVQLKSKGGGLTVYFNKTGDSFTDVYLEGPAAFVFTGEIEI
jgi:diaminopimelate epimerase